jgi:AraC-like DNA-binding protein
MRTPPAWSERFQTDDLDEVRAAFERFGPHRRDCLERGTLAIRCAMVDLGGVSVGWVESSLAQRVSATTQTPILHIPLAAPLTYRMGRRHFEATSGRAVFLPPGTEYTLVYGGESCAFALALGHLDSRSPMQWHGPKAPMELTLPAESMGRLTYDLQPLWGSTRLDPEGREAAQLRERLMSWTSHLIDRDDSPDRYTREAPARIRRVEEWLDAHLAEPIELQRLCEVAGIEARGLRKSFQQRRGMSPMQWVWSRRMSAARMRLMSAVQGETVTTIALDSGLYHQGRFAVAYRRRYGESPSSTLGRALARY